MSMKKLIRLSFQTLIVMSLLIANTSSAAAGGGKGSDTYIGQVSASASKSLPLPKAGEPGYQPNISQPLPGGGTATATAKLAWTVSRMDGIAKSSLSSNTVGTYSICATTVQLYMNSSPQGGAAQVCAAKTGGGSVTSKKSKVVASVFGKTWRVDTSHGFSKTGYGWYPTLSVSATP
ncbi:MAG: hypothetical protein HZB18_07540 [Chloroflexi bacterium]|nr:hypothetical protein [Chloroflexota bacterium]